jgi:hypothetical protein
MWKWLKDANFTEHGSTNHPQKQSRLSRASSKRDKFMQMFSWRYDEYEIYCRAQWHAWHFFPTI